MKQTRLDIERNIATITATLLTESSITLSRKIQMSDSPARHLGLDSLSRAELFRRIEKQFQIDLPDQLLASIDTLEEIAQYIEKTHAHTIHVERILQQDVHDETKRPDLTQSDTLIDVLIKYATHTPEKPHLYFQREEGGEVILTYGELYEKSLRVASHLRSLGLHEGEAVGIMQPTSLEFFYVFYGTLLAGGIPVPLYPPFRMHQLEAYAKTESRILRNAQIRILITFKEIIELGRLLKSFVPQLKYILTPDQLLKDAPLKEIYHAKSNHFALIQYTSGSTSDPKGVLLSHDNLLANIRAYGEAIQITPNDIAVSWLPLYHDMGLIGTWLGSLYFGIPLVLMTPFSFLNHPERWLWMIHRYRGTVSGAPNFAYELCAKKIPTDLLTGLDLSSWRFAANGAEKVYAKTLEVFAEKFKPFGFRKESLAPVYGLAESTVALTIPPLNQGMIVDKIDQKAFEEDQQAIPTDSPHALQFANCGKPIPNHEIRIVDENDGLLPERRVGRLQFRGPSSMQGYYRNPKATARIYHDGWLDSGDLAYQAAGGLYITGRKKDLIIKAGRNIYPAEIEEIVASVQGVRQGCVVAFGVTDHKIGTETLVVIAETKETEKQKRLQIQDAITNVLAESLSITPDQIHLVAPHSIPKTSSGKLQRAQSKKRYLAGNLGKPMTPTWLQITKLGIKAITKNMHYSFDAIYKSVYTFYVACLACTTLPLLYGATFITSNSGFSALTRFWAKHMTRLAGWRIKTVHQEYLTEARPMIFVANHASYIDAIVMLAILPHGTRFVAKKELWRTPFLRTFIKKLNGLPVDRADLAQDLKHADTIASVLKQGQSVLIFPEGTFGYTEGLRPFKMGAFKLAAETETTICPIALSGTRQILRDNEKLMRPHAIIATVMKSIAPANGDWSSIVHLRDEIRMQIAKHCGEATIDFIAMPS